MKNAGLNPKDAQLILGHAHITTTQQIYQHGDQDGQRQAMTLLAQAHDGGTQQRPAAGIAVRSAVNGEFSTGQGSEIAALTSGGPGGARTLDTLLKRCAQTPLVAPGASVIQHLRTRTNTYILGLVAVTNCCQTTRPSDIVYDHGALAAEFDLLDALRRQVFEEAL
ncbi:hypothetical protein [Nocardioides convexus]|uniref:hypothetical protein n=1 Tax=Nocardioides convexus TaxID=2712224 RepID=UPI00241834EB|nr:hypothetical protein [Nocardioides convexus]